MQHANGEGILAEQRVGQCRFADADATEHGDVQFTAFEFVEHRFEALEVGSQRFAHRRRNVRIIDKCAQALRGFQMMAPTIRGRRRG